jgi:hypothetical protein
METVNVPRRLPQPVQQSFRSRSSRAAAAQQPGTAIQFLGAMETVNVLPRRLPQPAQQSFRSMSSTLVCGGRPCCSSAAAAT